jgi:hypothetical protein
MQACKHMARFGCWPDQFRGFVTKYYAGRIPDRFVRLVAQLKRDRHWEVPELPSNGGRYCISVVGKNRITCFLQDPA